MNFSFIRDRRSFSDFIFILWAGGAALLSYSLVYALRKPFTAATFDGLSIWGMDYKVVVTITQILGYLLAKFIGIKLISELKGQHRLKFILGAIVLAELALVGFAILPSPGIVPQRIPCRLRVISLLCFLMGWLWDVCGE